MHMKMFLASLAIKEIQLRFTMEITTYLLIRMTKIKYSHNNKSCRECTETGSLIQGEYRDVELDSHSSSQCSSF